MKLPETYELMWRAITWPTGVADFLNKADASTREQFERCFHARPGLSAVERLDIYANAYYWRLHGVLVETFPTLAWLLGSKRTQNLITDYLLAHPSTDPDLRHLGLNFPTFIATNPLTSSRAGFVQVAQIEAAVAFALHAADGPTLAREELARLPAAIWPRMRIELAPATRVIACDWDYRALCEARLAGQVAPALDEIADMPEGRSVLLWRDGLRVQQRRVSVFEARCLSAFEQGQSFGELCASLSSPLITPVELARLAAKVAGFLDSWVGHGLLASASADPA